MPRNRKKTPAATPHTGKSRPISFRLDKTLVAHIDEAAKRLETTRNHVVALVLREYVEERGGPEIERIVNKDAENARQIDLFN